jgi:hypothetical protein
VHTRSRTENERAAGKPAKSEEKTMTIRREECANGEQLRATAEQLQTLADLIQKYPAEAQLLMTAFEEGLTLGPMRVMEPDGIAG